MVILRFNKLNIWISLSICLLYSSVAAWTLACISTRTTRTHRRSTQYPLCGAAVDLLTWMAPFYVFFLPSLCHSPILSPFLFGICSKLRPVHNSQLMFQQWSYFVLLVIVRPIEGAHLNLHFYLQRAVRQTDRVASMIGWWMLVAIF